MSSIGWLGIDLRGYLGERESVRVFGRWKEVDLRTLCALCELTCRNYRPSDDGSSDTPLVAFVVYGRRLTPRRVAFAAWLALAEGLPGFFAPVRKCQSLVLRGWECFSSLLSRASASTWTPGEFIPFTGAVVFLGAMAVKCGLSVVVVGKLVSLVLRSWNRRRVECEIHPPLD